VTAIISQTGWNRTITRSAEHSASLATNIAGSVSGSAVRGGSVLGEKRQSSIGSPKGQISGSIGIESNDRGATADSANASLDIVNYDVREAMARAEHAASRSASPANAFAHELSSQILGNDGLRNRYLEQADAARGTLDPSAPITSMEESSIIRTGRMSLDPSGGPTDGDAAFKTRRDQ
jgi:conjugal transfer mating pair stabilization protein TraG